MATQAEVAAHLDVSDRWLRQLVADGYISGAVRGAWDADKARLEYLRHQRRELERMKAENASLQAEINRLAGDAQAGNKASSEARRTLAQAEKLEMDLAERRGELVPAEQIADAVHGAVLIMKTRLAAVPAKAAPLVGAENIPLAERIIRDQVEEALAELAKAKVIIAAAGAAA